MGLHSERPIGSSACLQLVAELQLVQLYAALLLLVACRHLGSADSQLAGLPGLRTSVVLSRLLLEAISCVQMAI